MKSVNIDQVEFHKRFNDEMAILFDENDFGSSVKIQVVRVYPKGTIRKHKHIKRTELLFIMSGTGQIIVDGKQAATSGKDFVLCKPGEVHEIINKGDDELVVFVVRTNEAGDDDVIWLEEGPKAI